MRLHHGFRTSFHLYLQHSCPFSPSSPHHPPLTLTPREVSTSCTERRGGLGAYHKLVSQPRFEDSHLNHSSFLFIPQTWLLSSVNYYIKHECVTLTTEGAVEDSKIGLPSIYHHSPITKETPVMFGQPRVWLKNKSVFQASFEPLMTMWHSSV